MVNCAMCEAPATKSYNISGYGLLDVCENHYWVLSKNNECKLAELKENLRDSMIKAIHELNQIYEKIPINSTPAKSHYNRGWKFGLKQGIHEFSEILEGLMRK